MITTIILSLALLFSPSESDFGQVQMGAVVSGTLTVANDTENTERFILKSSCSCLYLDESEITLVPGENAEITYRFETETFKGKTHQEILFIPENSSLEPQSFPLYGTINRKGISLFTKPLPDGQIVQTPLAENIYHLFSYRSCNECASVYKEFSKKGTVYFYPLEKKENKDFIAEFSRKEGYSELPLVLYNGEIQAAKREKSAASRAKKMTVPAILAAGLLDGINPCAFTVIILFLSYLSLRMSSRRNILISGITYTAAVYVTYFLVGLGLFEFLRMMEAYIWIKIILKYVLTGLLIVLASLSLIDWYRCRKGRPQDMLLKLPKRLQNAVRSEIRKTTKSSRIVLSSLVLGFLVSLFELACTGQVYLPVIAVMVNSGDGQRGRGLALLAGYNLAFIIPLVAVFVLFWGGVSSKKMGDVFAKNSGAVKIIFAVLFLCFAALNFFLS